MAIITKWIDGKVPIRVDEDFFEKVKEEVKKEKAHEKLINVKKVVDSLSMNDLMDRNYLRTLCIIARDEINNE